MGSTFAAVHVKGATVAQLSVAGHENPLRDDRRGRRIASGCSTRDGAVPRELTLDSAASAGQCGPAMTWSDLSARRRWESGPACLRLREGQESTTLIPHAGGPAAATPLGLPMLQPSAFRGTVSASSRSHGLGPSRRAALRAAVRAPLVAAAADGEPLATPRADSEADGGRRASHGARHSNHEQAVVTEPHRPRPSDRSGSPWPATQESGFLPDLPGSRPSRG